MIWRADSARSVLTRRMGSLAPSSTTTQPPSKRGRKPRYGRKWPLASLLSAEPPTRERLTLYGKLTEVVFVVRDVRLARSPKRSGSSYWRGPRSPSSW